MLNKGSMALSLLAALTLSVSAWAGEAHWIDVRSASEYEAGHVDGAVNIPHTEITGRIVEVTENRDATLYLYCRSGRRSGIAQAALEQAGFTGAVNVGGFEEALEKANEPDVE